MLIYGAYLWAFILAGILFLLFRSKCAWWEYFVGFAVATVLICGSKAIVEKSQTGMTEYWGAAVQNAFYDEEWNEYIHETCSSTSCTGSGKDQTCTTTYYDCSYVKDHPPEWHITDTTGDVHEISPDYFEYLCNHFKNRTFVAMHHPYHTINGDRYVTQWDNSRALLRPVVTKHVYENRIVASDSILKFRTPTPQEIKTLGLYPAYAPVDDAYQQEFILGDAGDQKAVGERDLAFINAVYGPTKQIHVQILIFRGKSIQSGIGQQALWQNGNKNELNICIGLDKAGKVSWCYPFSWTEEKLFLIQTRNTVMAQRGKPLDIHKITTELEKTIPTQWKRRHFKDFSYLTVEPPMWTVILTNILVIIACIITGYIVINNDYEE